jgi:hypothetical protein
MVTCLCVKARCLRHGIIPVCTMALSSDHQHQGVWMFEANRNTSATCAGTLQQAFLDLDLEVRQLTMRGACAAWRRLRCFLTAGQTQAQLARIQRRINTAMRELSDLAALSGVSARLQAVRNSAQPARDTMHSRACKWQWCMHQACSC